MLRENGTAAEDVNNSPDKSGSYIPRGDRLSDGLAHPKSVHTRCSVSRYSRFERG